MSIPSKEQLVYLNIYDLQWSSFWPRKLVWILGLGVFHSAVEVYGTEFSFCGHPIHASGIFQSEPTCLGQINKICKYKTSILIGHTELSKWQVFQALDELGKNWQGPSYHLFSKNCNDFSENLCQVLCKKSIPDWVNRLAKFAASVPFLDTIVPTTWVQPRVQSRKPVQKERIRVRYPDQPDDDSDSDQWQATPCCSTSSKGGNTNGSMKKTVKKTLRARDISSRSASRNSVQVDRFDLSDSEDENDLILVQSPIRISSSEASRSPSPAILSPSRSSNARSRQPCRRKSTSQRRSRNRRKSHASRSRSKSRASRTAQSRSRSRGNIRASRSSHKQSRTRNTSKPRSSRSKSHGRTYRSKSRKRPATRTRTNSRGCKRRNLCRSQTKNREMKSASARKASSKSQPRRK